MSERATGWTFVGAQALLLGLLIVLPRRDDFTVPAWGMTLTDVVFWTGVLLALVAGISLGRALTATPVPTAAGGLRTNGLYRLVRHPIYCGVILIVAALAIRSTSLVSVAVGILALVFFNVKTGWEERRLSEKYAEYAAYAARTPRFVPIPRSNEH